MEATKYILLLIFLIMYYQCTRKAVDPILPPPVQIVVDKVTKTEPVLEEPLSLNDSLRIMDLIVDVEHRLQKVLKMATEIAERYPDHVARQLPEYLADLQLQIDQIKLFYQSTDTHYSVKRIAIDSDRLYAMDITFDAIEESLVNNTADPVTYEETVFFASGKFEINSSILDQKLNQQIEKIADAINRYDENQKVAVLLSVTGYADDQRVIETSQSYLAKKAGYPILSLDGNSELDRLRYYNLILSELRAKSVGKYFMQQVTNQVNHPHWTFNHDDFIGRGIEKPFWYKGNCYGDCPDRRVSVISAMVIAE